jgi:putative transposase
MYLVVGGNQWRMMPREYPKWQSVYYYFRKWRKTGLWQRIHDTLRARVREKVKRQKHPSAGCIDSQSVETTLVPGIRRYDAGKHVKGRKRHLLVDTLGLVLGVVGTAATVSDPAGARQLLIGLGGFCMNLRKIWADGTYRGELLNWAEAHFRFRVEPVLPPAGQKVYQVFPRCWVVKRTFAWFDANRRLSKD